MLPMGCAYACCCICGGICGGICGWLGTGVRVGGSVAGVVVELVVGPATIPAAARSRSIFSASMRSRSAFVMRGFLGAPVPRVPRARVLVEVVGSRDFSASEACVVPVVAVRLPLPRPRPPLPRVEDEDSTCASWPGGTSGPE